MRTRKKENILLGPMYDVPGSDISRVEITDKVVLGELPPIYTHRPGDLLFLFAEQ